MVATPGRLLDSNPNPNPNPNPTPNPTPNPSGLPLPEGGAKEGAQSANKVVNFEANPNPNPDPNPNPNPSPNPNPNPTLALTLTRPCANLARVARGATLLLHEASFRGRG